MQSWKPDIAASAGPKYLAIAEALSRDIQSGRLVAGDRLPPQRALAEALGVDLTTITRAYGEAQRLGLIEGDGRRGSFVRARGPSPADLRSRAEISDAGMNAPPELGGGLLSLELRRSVEALLGSSDPLALQYQPRGGMPAARECGARLLVARDVPCFDDSVVVTAGGQHALHAIFSAELRPGDVLAVAPHVYPGLLALAARFGVELRAVSSDREGLDPDALDALCTVQAVRGLYVVPTNDNPTTTTMSLERRKAIAAVADRHGLLIIEDDAYGMLPEQALGPIAAFAPERTWHVASVSKILSPGLRVAWLRAPDVAAAWRLAADMHETAIMAPPLNTAVVVDWIERGLFATLVGEVRAEARARQALVRKALPAGSYAAHDDGYHLWVPLGGEADPSRVADALRAQGLSAIASEAFAVDRAEPGAALRVSIGGTLTRDRLERGLRLLGALADPRTMRKTSLV